MGFLGSTAFPACSHTRPGQATRTVLMQTPALTSALMGTPLGPRRGAGEMGVRAALEGWACRAAVPMTGIPCAVRLARWQGHGPGV